MKVAFHTILLFLFAVTTACSQVKEVAADGKHYPKPNGLVNDFDNIFTGAEKRALDSLVTEFEKRTTIEIAIVTLTNEMVKREDFNTYNLELAKSWGVGKKEKNNGILIGISNSIQMIRINNGVGIEEVLSDAETKQIIDGFIIPEFRKGKFFDGTKNGVVALIRHLE